MSSPELIFGCASLGKSFTTKEEVEELGEALQDAHNSRIDTAARYPPTSPGSSEKLIGEANLGKSFTIDTKIMVSGDGSGSLTATNIGNSLENSLKSLGVTKVNVLYCHAPDKITPISEQAAAMDKYHKEGKFVHLGVSNFPLGMLEEWLAVCEKEGYVKPSVYQGQYNLLCRAYEDGLFPMLRKYGIHFTAYSPLAGGFLTGKLTPNSKAEELNGTRFEIADNNPFGKAFRHWYDKPSMHEAIAKLRTLSATNNISMEGAAMRWLRFHSSLKEGDGIIVGASKVQQVQSTGETSVTGPLPEGLAEELSGLWEICKVDGAAIAPY